MGGHTKELWKADGGYISGADGLCVANTLEDDGANARRIVACVNAFAEFHDTEIIEDMLAGGFSVRELSKYAYGLYRQRDELLAALKESRRELHACQAVIHLAGGFDPAYVSGAQESLKKIDAIIAQAEAR